MKNSTLTKKSKLISIACIIAILLAMCCQFVSGWQFSGTTNNVNTREERALDMEMSVAAFVWQPYTEAATAFKNYANDPTLDIYEELLVDKNVSDEQLAAKALVFDKSTAIVTVESDEAEVQQIVLDESYDHDAVVAEKAAEVAEEVAEEEVAEEEVAEEAAEEADEVKSSNAVTRNSNMVISIVENHVDPIAEAQTTVLASSVDKEAALVAYEDAIDAKNSEGATKFINGIAILPTILLVIELLCIVLIALNMRKGKGTLFATIATFLIGVLSFMLFYTEPMFLLFQSGSFTTIDVILSIVTLLGLFFTVDSFDYKAWSKGALKFAKNSAFVYLLTGVVLTVIGVLASKVMFVGATAGLNSLSLILGLIILVYGILVIAKAIISGIKDNALVKKANN